jgi:mRNA interferase MazF
VAAITSRIPLDPYPIEVVVEAGSGLQVRSTIRLDQIRSVDRDRLVRRMGSVDAGVMKRVDHALKISLGLIEL